MEKSASKDRDMSTAAASTLRDYAATKWPLVNHKGRLAKLCRELSTWTDRRVRAVYNAEQGVSLRADEQSDIEKLTQEARHEYRDLATLAASLEALLYGPEADFYREKVDAIRAALVHPRGGSAESGGGNGS